MGHIHIWLKDAKGDSYCAQCAAKSPGASADMFSMGKEGDLMDARIPIEEQDEIFERAQRRKTRENFW
jgi:hypothetical protein